MNKLPNLECINMNIHGEEYSLVLKQIETSRDTISELIDECEEMVTNIKIANDLREINRRKEEKKSEKIRTSYLEEEASKAQKQFDEINSKWEPITKYNDCIDIYTACEDQRKKCEDLLNCKNDVIENLKKELAKADDRFVNDQIIQRNDINILSHRINEQIDILHSAYRKHLKLIEDAVIQERTVMLDKYQSEWEQLNEKHEQEEIRGMNERSKMVEQFEKEIDDMYSEHFEKFNVTKENLELELQKLQIDYEGYKATYLLEENKLEYNYLVLTKRQQELVHVKSEQKQKINRLRDTLTEIRQEMNEKEKCFQAEEIKMKREISDINKDFQRNSEKMQRLKESNENTFKKVWQLNVKRATALLKKIFQIDEKIHKEVLHVEWKPIEFKLISMNDLPSIQIALQHSAKVGLSQKDDRRKESKESSIFPSISSDVHLTKFILREIVKNVEFLDERVNRLIDDLPDSQQDLVHYDYILKALKIEKQSEMDLLKKYIIPQIKCLNCSKTREDIKKLSKYEETLNITKRTGSGFKRNKIPIKRPSSAPQSEKKGNIFKFQLPKIICGNPEHSWHVDKFQLINAISEFIAEMKKNKSEKKCVPLRRICVSRILTKKDMELYWEKFNLGFPKAKEFTWDVTQKYLNDYLSATQELSKLFEEVDSVQKQNSELKLLLGQFSVKIDS